MRILLATENPGKFKEFQELFAETRHDLVSLADFSSTQAEETGQTFVENALLKARHASELSGLPCLADDSGLAVNALGGQPGIFSARYAASENHGELSRDEANNRKLLRELEAHSDRRASFYCALVLLRHPADPVPMIATGRWQGTIGRTASGHSGFGYDPLFIDDATNKTAAALRPEEKHSRSHRGLAWQMLAPQLAAL